MENINKEKRIVFNFFFFGHPMLARGILVPQPGIKLASSALETRNLNH